MLIEIGVLVFVAFQPQTRNLLANSLTSLACGFQVEAFRKIHGNSIATTMCIGNFRAGLHALGEYWFSRKRSDRNKALTYFIVIAFFALGPSWAAASSPGWGSGPSCAAAPCWPPASCSCSSKPKKKNGTPFDEPPRCVLYSE